MSKTTSEEKKRSLHDATGRYNWWKFGYGGFATCQQDGGNGDDGDCEEVEPLIAWSATEVPLFH